MGIQYVGGTSAGFAGGITTGTVSLTSLSGGLASAPAEDDIVIVVYAVGADGRSPSLTIEGDSSSLYSIPFGSPLGADDTYDVRLHVFYQVQGATPDTSLTRSATGHADDAGAIAVHVYRGVDTADPFDVAAAIATATNSGQPDPPSITPVTSGAVVVATGAAANSSLSAFTSSDLEKFLTAGGSDVNSVQVGIGGAAWGGSGDIDASQWGGGASSSGASWASLVLALKPLDGGGSGSGSGGSGGGGDGCDFVVERKTIGAYCLDSDIASKECNVITCDTGCSYNVETKTIVFPPGSIIDSITDASLDVNDCCDQSGSGGTLVSVRRARIGVPSRYALSIGGRVCFDEDTCCESTYTIPPCNDPSVPCDAAFPDTLYATFSNVSDPAYSVLEGKTIKCVPAGANNRNFQPLNCLWGGVLHVSEECTLKLFEDQDYFCISEIWNSNAGEKWEIIFFEFSPCRTVEGTIYWYLWNIFIGVAVEHDHESSCNDYLVPRSFGPPTYSVCRVPAFLATGAMSYEQPCSDLPYGFFENVQMIPYSGIWSGASALSFDMTVTG